MQLRLQVARDVWGKHPDELAGEPWAPYMLTDMMSLALVEREDHLNELEKIKNGIGN